jgi:uncharacterized protein YnzC (UPF0291/DUF896 family)
VSEFAIVVIAILLADMIRPYLKKRAEDYATLQAIEKNTTAVEKIRKDFLGQIEKVKATLQKQVHSHNLFKQKQMQLSLELWNQMVKSQAVAFEILKLVKFECDVPDFGSRLTKLGADWEIAIYELRRASELAIPFQPDDINEIIVKYDKGQTGLVKKFLEKIRMWNEGICGSHEKLMQELESDWKNLRRVYLDAGKDLFQKLEHIYVVDME